MLNLDVRFPQTTDWQNHTNSPTSSKQPDNMGGGQGGLGGLGGGDPMSAGGMQDNPLFQFITMLLSALMQNGQQGGSDGAGGGGQSGSPFGDPSSANNTMGNLGNNALKDAMQPTSQGGTQLPESTKPLNSEVGKMMDTNPGTFGTPNAPKGVDSGNGGTGDGSLNIGGGAPNIGGAPGTGGTAGTGGAPGTGSSNAAGAASGTMFPKASSDAVVIDEPIVVKAGETFDGGGKTYTASSKLGDGGQSEDQKPLFILEDGASLKNVVLGDNEADGIHTHGDAKLDNVHWTDVGEDALTMKEGGRVEISNSSAKNADDKIFQLNDDGTLILNNVQADNFGKLVRTNGGQQGNWDIQLNDVKATNGKHALVQSDSNSVNVTGNNVQTENVKGMYKLPDSGTLSLS